MFARLHCTDSPPPLAALRPRVFFAHRCWALGLPKTSDLQIGRLADGTPRPVEGPCCPVPTS